MVKKNIFIGLLVIILVAGAGYYGYAYLMSFKSGKLEAEKNQKEISKIVEGINEEREEQGEDMPLKSTSTYKIEDIYHTMHIMSNTKIIADGDNIWGQLEIDKESISTIKGLVEAVDYADRDYLLTVLARWEQEDFSQADKEHNYFWAKLGGTVGKAIGVKK